MRCKMVFLGFFEQNILFQIFSTKTVFRTHNPLSSQIISHLNKEPSKVQSLSLLIGSGSDRQHKCFSGFTTTLV